MTDVLLTHSYFQHFDPKQTKAHTPYPPLGTLYAASVLRQAGFSVRVFDSMLARSEQEIVPLLQKHRPKIVAVYDDDFNYLTKMCLLKMRDAAYALTRIAKDFGATVLVHGSDPTDHAAGYIQHGADAVILGEGETTLLELCQAIRKDGASHVERINGVAFLKNGTVLRSLRRPLQKNLDTMPFPAWDLVDLGRYRSIWKKYHGSFSINAVTTRGCPFHCNWCAKPIYGQAYTSRSPQNVVEEMKQLIKLAGPDHLWFADDIFGLKPGWVQAFRDSLKKEGIRIPFKIQARADLLLERDTIPALAEAGCEEVWIGAESGSQRILDAMEKGITVGQIRQVRAKLGAAGIRSCFFLQLGYRSEKKEDIRATIDMVRQLRPDNIGVSVSYPLPGTKFYGLVKEEMQEKKNWSDSDDLAMMYAGTYAPEYYRILHRYIHRNFRLQQGLSTLSHVLSGIIKPGPGALKKILGIGYHAPLAFWKRVQLIPFGGI